MKGIALEVAFWLAAATSWLFLPEQHLLLNQAAIFGLFELHIHWFFPPVAVFQTDEAVAVCVDLGQDVLVQTVDELITAVDLFVFFYVFLHCAWDGV